MFRNLFESFEDDVAEENFQNAMIEQLINGDVRDAYMREIHDNSSSVIESQLMDDPLFSNYRESIYEGDLEDLKYEQECGSKCCDSYSEDGNDLIDSETRRNIDLLPETDPKDVGSYFDNTSSVAAECNKESFDRAIRDGMEMVNIYIN